MTTAIKAETIGKRVKRARQWAGFENQTALAEALGVVRQTVSNWESDQQVPPRVALLALQLLTGFQVSWFETGVMPGQTSSDGRASNPGRRSSDRAPFRSGAAA